MINCSAAMSACQPVGVSTHPLGQEQQDKAHLCSCKIDHSLLMRHVQLVHVLLFTNTGGVPQLKTVLKRQIHQRVFGLKVKVSVSPTSNDNLCASMSLPAPLFMAGCLTVYSCFCSEETSGNVRQSLGSLECSHLCSFGVSSVQ